MIRAANGALMSVCSRTSSTSRRRIAAVVAPFAGITASAPLLLRHSGSSDWTDGALGLVVGLSIGIALAATIVTIRRARSSD